MLLCTSVLHSEVGQCGQALCWYPDSLHTLLDTISCFSVYFFIFPISFINFLLQFRVLDQEIESSLSVHII